jgi:glycosidase
MTSRVSLGPFRQFWFAAVVLVGSIVAIVPMGRAMARQQDSASAAKLTAHKFNFDARQQSPQPGTVNLAGTFNGWSKEATPMKSDGSGVWTIEIPLADGVHHYKFVLDGDKWLNDPNADKSLEIDDGHGGMNSGLMIGPDARKLSPIKPNQINANAVLHDPADPMDLNVASTTVARVRARVQAGDAQRVLVHILDDGASQTRDVELYRTGTKLGFDSYAGVVSSSGQKLTYYISVVDGSAGLVLDEQGKLSLGGEAQARKLAPWVIPMTPTFQTPDWAKNAVWYQIFPERFRNGDPSNDPGDQWYERKVKWTSDWWKTQPGEAPGQENFYKGEGNIWKRRYGGDIQGVKQALPYLRSLGINAIYFNPVFEADSMHKYDASDYRHIDDNFGVKGDLPIPGETDDPSTWQWSKSDKVFLDFIEEAHRQGFKVVIDGVFNHVGKSHLFFQDVLKNGKNSKYADWFEITDWGTGGEPGKPGGIQYKAWDGDNGHLPVFKKDPKLGLAPGPREHVFAVTKRWLAPDGDPSKGIDGWRLDVPGDIPHPFWIDWRKVVKATKPDAYITGEIWDWAQAWLQGDQFDAVMNYRFAVAAQDFFVNRSKAIKPSELNDRAMAIIYNYPLQVALVQQNLFDSHDTDRLASMFVNPDLNYDATNRLQDNGPKYKSDKPTPEMWQRMKQAVAFQMTFVGAPMTYYGNEVGMWSPDDPSNRQPMVWKDLDPYDDPEVKFNPDIFDFYQRAIAVRNTLPALRTGSFRAVTIDDADEVYTFARALGDQTVFVALNRSEKSRSVQINVGSDGSFIDWLDPTMAEVKKPANGVDRPSVVPKSGGNTITSSGGKLTIELKPYSTAVLSSSPSPSGRGPG